MTDEYERLLAEMLAISYEENHRSQNQERIIKGVCINPVLREGFDDTANDDRDSLEIKDWWGNPFIVVRDIEPADNSYKEFVQR